MYPAGSLRFPAGLRCLSCLRARYFGLSFFACSEYESHARRKPVMPWPRYSCSRFIHLLLLLLCALTGCVTPQETRWRLYNEDGVLLFAQGDYRNALDSFGAALNLRPNDPVLIYNAAQCYDRLGDVKKAEQFYTYCLQLDPKHGDAHLGLITLIYRSGRMAQANQMICDWLNQDSNSADPYVADAWRLRQEKNYPAAQGRVQQAIGLEPANRRAVTELAILYEILGMPDRAYVLYEGILSREPQQIEIAERFAQLKAKGVRPPLPD
jgi:tetratricopeptide (TPR) repeat protein